MSARIDVNTAESRIANTRLLPISDSVDNVVNQLTHLLLTIDPRILNQNNLHARLLNARNDTASIEADIRSLHSGILNMLSQYEQAEQSIMLSSAPSGGLMGSPSVSKNRQAFSDAAITTVATGPVAARPHSGLNVQTGTTITGSANSATPGIIKRANNANVSGR